MSVIARSVASLVADPIHPAIPHIRINSGIAPTFLEDVGLDRMGNIEAQLVRLVWQNKGFSAAAFPPIVSRGRQVLVGSGIAGVDVRPRPGISCASLYLTEGNVL